MTNSSHIYDINNGDIRKVVDNLPIQDNSEKKGDSF